MNTSSKAGSAHRVIIADDHPLFRTALSQAVSQALGEPELLTVGSVDELTALLADSHGDADLLLLDLNMPGARGYSALVHARSVASSLPVIVVSAHEDASIAQASLEHGAAGFIPKSSSPETMAEAIAAVLSGQRWIPEHAENAEPDKDSFTEKLATLTPQQQRVLMMLTDGLLNKQIAIDLDISEATVKAHITAILRKLEVHTRTQAVIAARSLEIDWGNYARRELNDSNS
ncbi:response regulator transcription factor [Salinisphaera sp. LB1]|uniref:response regulator n=1 Tax=Salinisphaera sp. LB1 TaxID=2183911 RepID=UPI000D707A45|nr:response regulator transcription factor [Salinisphaera sp. LB1]AWN17496.1 Transcriptional regulator, LuxR family [Salinisphaera sp. LB1]